MHLALFQKWEFLNLGNTLLSMTWAIMLHDSLFLPALVDSNIPQPNLSILIIKITLDVQPIQL